jgi:DNA-binding Lrp family transcriptional regulator
MSEQKLLRLLRELMRNSRRSDRDIAKLFGSSQPTITRTRTQLEKRDYIKTYTIIPDFAKLGYEILAFTFTKMKTYPTQEESEKIMKHAREWVNKRPNVIFSADGEGIGSDLVLISFHKNYGKYADFMRTLALEWGDMISEAQSFIVSVATGFRIKPFDLKYLADDEQ